MAPTTRQQHTLASIRADRNRIKDKAKRAVTSVITRRAARVNTAYTVFYTTELLELILSGLPMKDLLLSQRVSQKWRNVVNTNRRLQEKLFLRSTGVDTHWKLEQSQDPSFRYRTVTRQPHAEPGNRNAFNGVIFNPLLFTACSAGHEIHLLYVSGNNGHLVLRFDLLGSDDDSPQIEKSWYVHELPIRTSDADADADAATDS